MLRTTIAHYRSERNHQGKSNVLPFPLVRKHAGRGVCDVANGSAGSCAITIKTPRELAGQAIIKPPFGGCHVRLKSANSRAAPWVRRLSINNRGMFKSQSKRIFA